MVNERPNRLCRVAVLASAVALSVPVHAQGLAGVFKEQWRFEGSAERDVVGAEVAGVGDIDQDGFDDVMVGASGTDPMGMSRAGSAFVYSGRDGSLIWRFDGPSPGAGLGIEVAGAGDVNGDGVPDLLAGAPGTDVGGSAFVYSGMDGSLLWQFDGQTSSDNFGAAVAGPGDVNRDGFDDVVVNSSLAASPQVYSGRDGSLLWSFSPHDDNGSLVGRVGDVDRDGFDDVLTGATHPTGAGCFFVYSGRDGSVLLHEVGRDRVLMFSVPVSGAGDVNRDGVPDVILGEPYGLAGILPPFTVLFDGSATVFSGADGSVLLRFRSSEGPFGDSVAAAGDVNQDGFDDVLVGTDAASGAVAWLYSGKDGRELWRFESAPSDDSPFVKVAGAGDINRDGFPDVVTGSGRDDVRGVENLGSATVHAFQPALLHYGTGIEGTGNLIPRIGTGGEVPSVGNSAFVIEVNESVGGALCAIAGSVARTETPMFGGTLYGDFLSPGQFSTSLLMTSGPVGFPGTGVATQSVGIPNNPSLIGLTTYWQGFVFDDGSPLPIAVSHTDGLSITVVQ